MNEQKKQAKVPITRKPFFFLHRCEILLPTHTHTHTHKRKT